MNHNHNNHHHKQPSPTRHLRQQQHNRHRQQQQQPERLYHPHDNDNDDNMSDTQKEDWTTAVGSTSSLEEGDDDEPLPLDEARSDDTSVVQHRSSSALQQQQLLENVQRRKTSLSELIECLNQFENIDQQQQQLDPELYRRCADFRLAQQKRIEKYGRTQPWGIYGVSLHLSQIKTDLEWAEDAAWRRLHHQPYMSWTDFDQARQRTVTPYFTYALMVLISALMVVEFAVNDWKMEPLDVNPLLGPSAETLVDLGALDTPKIVHDGQWWRLFTAPLLHAGILHWLVNVLALLFFGGVLERCHGTLVAVFLFWMPAVGGNVLSAIFLPQYISVGASGGIFGFMGASVADISLHWRLVFLKIDGNEESKKRRTLWALVWMGVEMVVNVLLGLTPYIDNFIHLGGFVYGILGGWTVLEYEAALRFLGYQASWRVRLRVLALRFAGVLACLVFLVVSSVFLATMQDVGRDTPCPSCRYFNCVPFPSRQNPWWHCDDCIRVSAELFRSKPSNDTTSAEYSSSYYTRVELTCPNDVVESVNVTEQRITDKQVITDQLPEYCRDYCDDLYAS